MSTKATTAATSLFAMLLASVMPALYAQGATLQVPSAGSAQVAPAASGLDAIQDPELFPGFAGTNIADSPSAASAPASAAVSVDALLAARSRMTNRSIARSEGRGDAADGLLREHDGDDGKRHAPVSFDGLNSRDQRLANGGNQFSTEPPDQALCVGNGFVFEAVNDVVRVNDTLGNRLTGAVDLNTFYGYPAAINRATRRFGPFVTDPVCHYDAQVRRWFLAVLTLATNPATGGFTGGNTLDLAVSATADPRGPWTIYRIPAQNDGTAGTPVHANCPCLGDYPHIGADAHGIYLTTNEFPFAGGFNSAQIYAISKRDLISGVADLRVTLIDTADDLFEGAPGFTVRPAITPSGHYARANDGTEYFLSSLAVFTDAGVDSRLRIWALGNTESLDDAKPAVKLTHNVLDVKPYSVPPGVTQKVGSTPVADCLNDRTLPTAGGPGCWRLLVRNQPKVTEHEESLDPNDSRIQQVMFEDGHLYAALDTGVNVGGVDRTGIAYFVIKPVSTHRGVSGLLEKRGNIAVAGNHVTRPSIAVKSEGEGIIGFTLSGQDHFPSAAYVRLHEGAHRGPVRIVAEGAGPDDGFSGYLTSAGTSRGRWGDYSAAAVDGESIWFATEYIAQTCTLAQYLAAPIGSCGGTRVALTNWGTRISQVNLDD